MAAKRAKKRRLNIEGVLPVTIFKEGDAFVAYTPVLDLSSCGRTFKEAQANLEEAVNIFFEECLEHGTLEDALASLGWSKLSEPPGVWSPPKVVGHTQLPVPTTI